MTNCCSILVRDGVVMIADTRTNADGFDAALNLGVGMPIDVTQR